MLWHKIKYIKHYKGKGSGSAILQNVVCSSGGLVEDRKTKCELQFFWLEKIKKTYHEYNVLALIYRFITTEMQYFLYGKN